MNLQEVVEKRKSFRSGSRVINCVLHMGLPITERPENCHLCHTDMGNFINYVLRVNEFTNELLDEVEKIAVEHGLHPTSETLPVQEALSTPAAISG